MMIGGETAVVQRLDPIFATLAPGIGDIDAHAGPRRRRRHRRAGLSALRAERRRPLRQDGPQRHRVRPHGGVRRRPEHPAAPRTSASRQHAVDAETTPLRDPEHYQYDLNLPDIAEVWRRGSVIASWLLDLTANALRRGSRARELLRPGLRFRRRPLDDQGRDRRGGAGAGADDRALRALQLARRSRVPGQAAVGDALRVRRPRRKADGEVETSRARTHERNRSDALVSSARPAISPTRRSSRRCRR